MHELKIKDQTPHIAKHVLGDCASSEVHLEDCVTALKRYPDNHFDLAIVDPPYGIGMDNSNKRTKPSRPNSYTDKYKDFRYHDANWDNEMPSKEYFNELFRVSKN